MSDELNKVVVFSKIKRMNKKYGKVNSIEIKKRDPFLPPYLEEKLRKQIPHMKVITANELAAKYDIRVSTMKKFLKNLKDEEIIKEIAGSSRLRIYSHV